MPEVVLLGGPAHGARYSHDGNFPPNALEGSIDGVKTTVYLGRMFVSNYPIPGWEFFLVEGNPYAVKPWNRVTPWWRMRLFTTHDYAVIVNRALVNLSTALATHDYARSIQSDNECVAAQMNINAALNVLLALVSGRDNKYTDDDKYTSDEDAFDGD